MNQFNNDQVPSNLPNQDGQQMQGGQVPVNQMGQAEQQPVQQQSGNPGQFQMPPNATDQMGQYQQSEMEPQQHSSGKTWMLIILLVIILILGGLVFASFEGWISLGPVDKLLGKGVKVTEETSTTTTTSNNDATRKTDLVKIKDALKSYYQANQSYPVSEVVDKTNDPKSVLTVLIPTYLPALPTDPISTQYYGYTSDGKTFTLTAVLDDTTDPTGVKAGNYYLYKVTDTSTEAPTATTTTETETETIEETK